MTGKGENHPHMIRGPGERMNGVGGGSSLGGTKEGRMGLSALYPCPSPAAAAGHCRRGAGAGGAGGGAGRLPGPAHPAPVGAVPRSRPAEAGDEPRGVGQCRGALRERLGEDCASFPSPWDRRLQATRRLQTAGRWQPDPLLSVSRCTHTPPQCSRRRGSLRRRSSMQSWGLGAVSCLQPASV